MGPLRCAATLPQAPIKGRCAAWALRQGSVKKGSCTRPPHHGAAAPEPTILSGLAVESRCIGPRAQMGSPAQARPRVFRPCASLSDLRLVWPGDHTCLGASGASHTRVAPSQRTLMPDQFGPVLRRAVLGHCLVNGSHQMTATLRCTLGARSSGSPQTTGSKSQWARRGRAAACPHRGAPRHALRRAGH